MKKKASTVTKVEGEGSYSATRAYNAKLRAFEKDADVPALANRAKRALDQAEGNELRKAERQAKAGAGAPGPISRTARGR